MFDICKECNEYRNILKENTCRTCYNRVRLETSMDICLKCGDIDVYLEGYCKECFNKRNGITTDKVKGFCLMCGEERIIDKREVCYSCYDRLYRPTGICVKCKKHKIIHGKHMCKSCRISSKNALLST